MKLAHPTLFAALLLAACTDGAAPGVAGQGGASSSSSVGVGGVELPPAGECAGVACLPCAKGNKCADGAAHIDGTCCAEGDALVHLAEGPGSEVVDLESNGTYALMCGGFGAAVSNVSDPTQPSYLGAVSERCQRAAFGGAPAGGGRNFYVAHHGDSWVPSPFLATYRVDGLDTLQVDHQTEPGVLYEGLAWQDGYLYVAAHGDGLRVYQTSEDGTPSFLTALGGFGNAWKIATVGNTAYVADNTLGLVVVDITTPASPSIVDTLKTSGQPRDVDHDDTYVYVALGGGGVDVFDAATNTPVVNIETLGSAQAVAADNGALAVAGWNHVATYDTDTWLLTGTEKLLSYPEFEQDLGVAMAGDIVYVGEWEGLHLLRHRQGYVAPDLWIDEQMYQFPPQQPAARAVVMRNVGRRTLEISDVSVSDPAFTVSDTSLSIAAGAANYIEVGYQPPAPTASKNLLQLVTNDPDPQHANYSAGLLTASTTALDVGDTISDAFGFLDPSGANQLSGLEGHVVVIAYFALF